MSTAGSTPTSPRYKLTFYVPPENRSACLDAIFATGAGTWPEGGGLYRETCFVTRGMGQFRSSEQANPAIGKRGDLEKVEEDKVEMIVAGTECVKAAVQKLKEAHPYEVVAYFVTKVEDI